MYHLSKNDGITYLSARVPKKLLTRNNAFEDTTIPRVSFAPTIKKCILGLQPALTEFLNGELVYFIYSPYNYDESLIVNNDEIISKKLVYDAEITNECWYTGDVNVKLIGSITVYDKITKVIEYKPIRVSDSTFLKPNGMLDTFLYKYSLNNSTQPNETE